MGRRASHLMGIRLLVFCGCCAFAAAQEPASPSPAPVPRTVRSVEFRGLRTSEDSFVRDVVQIKVGDAVQPEALDHAVSRLMRTGRFAVASFQLDEQADGVGIVFELRERPVVKAIKFEGRKDLSESKLREKVTQKVDGPVDWIAVRDGRDSILALYKEAGYSDAAVTYDQQRLEETGDLVYVIKEGKRIRVRKIFFEGNRTFGDRRLKKHVETKTYLWIFRTGAFDRDVAEGDLARLQNFYRDEGFLDVTASYRTEFAADGKDMTVIFSVVEGRRYAIESIEFRGNAVFPSNELRAMLGSQVGATVKRPQVENDAKAIRARYGENGYIYSNVRISRVFSEKPDLVRINLDIEEGEQFRVGYVRVRGNSRTKDKVVRRALNLYPPDDLWDLTEAKEAEKRLLATRIFSSAKVYPVGDQAGVRDAVIDVVESEKAGDFLFGFGVTSNSGLVGNIVLDFKNFDITDRPRSLAEFLKFRSFFGGGQTLRLELQPGTEVTRARIDFTEPYLFDKPIRFDSSLFLFERERDGYTEERVGATVSFGKKFERGLLRGWSGEISFKVQDVQVDDVDLFASNEIRRDEGTNILTSVKGALVRDRTDNRFIPSTGDRLRAAYEQYGMLGGDHTFGEFTTGYTRYLPLHTDALERKHVLALNAEGGAMIGEAPVFERFYAGGTGSIRGFEYRGIGPRDGIDQNNVGGDWLLLFGGEYSFPLVGENLRGLMFLDAGSAGPGPIRSAIGAGVRFTIDLFGPVPFEFDLALPWLKDSEDEEQVFSFLIGSAY